MDFNRNMLYLYMETQDMYREKYKQLFPELNERSRRLVAAADAQFLGHGGIEIVHKASGLSRGTISQGMKELAEGTHLPEGRSRRAGGGRKKCIDTDGGLWPALDQLVSPVTRGDPQSPLRWTTKSTRKLALELNNKGHQVSHSTVGSLLKSNDYSLQGNRKGKEGSAHPDRDAQFQYIQDSCRTFLELGDPVISVDAKKKELVGHYKNGGQEWEKKGEPVLAEVHDFPDRKQWQQKSKERETLYTGKALPYGIYDLKDNTGYVNVGINHDTGEFAVASIRRWWNHLGQQRYSDRKRLLITADGGGSNGYRLRLWKKELQEFSDETGLEITVCHFPPGTSKWNKIEHRLFSFISINWRAKPLTSYQVIVNLIANTTTETGLKVYAALDENIYELRKKISDGIMASLNIQKHEFHGEWNYTIYPRNK